MNRGVLYSTGIKSYFISPLSISSAADLREILKNSLIIKKLAKKILTNEKRRAASPTLSSQEWNPRLRRAILGHRKIEKKQNPSVVKQIIPVETPAKLLPLPSLKAVKTFAKKTLKAPLILTQPVPSSVLPAAVGLDTPSEIFIDRYDIPATYHKTWIALMAKDPYALYAAWEISPSEFNVHSGQVVLRVYDVRSEEHTSELQSQR